MWMRREREGRVYINKGIETYRRTKLRNEAEPRAQLNETTRCEQWWQFRTPDGFHRTAFDGQAVFKKSERFHRVGDTWPWANSQNPFHSAPSRIIVHASSPCDIRWIVKAGATACPPLDVEGCQCWGPCIRVCWSLLRFADITKSTIMVWTITKIIRTRFKY